MTAFGWLLALLVTNFVTFLFSMKHGERVFSKMIDDDEQEFAEDLMRQMQRVIEAGGLWEKSAQEEYLKYYKRTHPDNHIVRKG